MSNLLPWSAARWPRLLPGRAIYMAPGSFQVVDRRAALYPTPTAADVEAMITECRQRLKRVTDAICAELEADLAEVRPSGPSLEIEIGGQPAPVDSLEINLAHLPGGRTRLLTFQKG